MASLMYKTACCLQLLLIIFLSTKGLAKDCPDLSTKEDFDLQKMEGVWNEIRILPNIWERGRCFRINVSQIDEKSQQASIKWERITPNSTVSYAISYVKAKNETTRSKMSLFFTQPYVEWPLPFWVLGTDYESFALIYSCSPIYDENTNTTETNELAWLMARKREMNPGLKGLMEQFLSVKGIDTTRLVDVDQTDCDPYDFE